MENELEGIDHCPHTLATVEKTDANIGKAIRDLLKLGIPWGTIIQQLLTLALPAFLAWVQSLLNPPKSEA